MAGGSVEAQLPYTDALPYHDDELERVPGMRAAVAQEIEREKQRLGAAPAPPALVAEPPTAFDAERARAERGEKLDVLDTSRYQLPGPVDPATASEEAWAESVRNAEIQLAHMDGRLKTLELLRRYGPNVWRLHNYDQESMLQFETHAHDAVEEHVAELNRQRKEMQLAVGDRLDTYESRWAALVSKNLSIRAANLTASAELHAFTEQADALQRELDAMEGR